MKHILSIINIYNFFPCTKRRESCYFKAFLSHETYIIHNQYLQFSVTCTHIYIYIRISWKVVIESFTNTKILLFFRCYEKQLRYFLLLSHIEQECKYYSTFLLNKSHTSVIGISCSIFTFQWFPAVSSCCERSYLYILCYADEN